jgi:hypothetical protein
VVEHKSKNAKPQADFLSYEDYTKVEFDLANATPFRKLRFLRRKFGFVLGYFQNNDRDGDYLPLLMKESITEVYQRNKGKDRKDIIRADRFSGVENESVSDFLGGQLEEIDPYDNVIVLAGKSFIGPFAGTANLTYRFFLTDSTVRNGDKFYRLEFAGRSKQDLTFLGRAWIHGRSYAIEHIYLEISPHANINFVQRYSVEQWYKAMNDSVWLKNKEYVQAKVAAVKRKKKDPINMMLRKTMSRQKIRWNEAIPDSIFQGPKQKWDPLVYKRDEAYWTQNRHQALSAEEAGIYKMVDSVKKSRTFKFYYNLIYTVTTGYLPTGPVEWGHFLEAVSWNDVEGIRFKLAARTNRKFSKDLSLNAYLAFGTKDLGLKGGFGFSWRIPDAQRRWRQLWGNYRYDYSLIGQINRFQTYDNIFTSLTRTRPLDKLMKIQGGELTYGHGWTRGLSQSFSVKHRIFYALPNNGFSFSNSETATDKFSVSEAQINTHWGPGEFFFRNNNIPGGLSLGSKLPVFDFDYTFRYMRNLLGRDYLNHRAELRMRHRLNWQLGYTKYLITAAKIFGPAPYPVLNIHLGNENFLYNRHAFNMMNFFEFASDAFVSLHFDHHFDGFFLNKIPLIRRLQMREIFIFKGLYGTLDPRNVALMAIPESLNEPRFYAEVGFGIENIFKVLRVDFLWRLTHLDLPSSQPFGVKFTFSPKF